MRIWVKSQNENRIILVDHFSSTKNGVIIGFQGPDDECGVLLGQYASEFRAKDILKEITIRLRMNHKTFDMPEK